MPGIDKIVEQILSDAKAQRDIIIGDANKKSEKLLESVRVQTQAECDVLLDGQRQKAEDAGRISSSSGELKYRRLVLSAKTDMINGILKDVKTALKELPDNEYFNTLSEMVLSYAHKGEKGLIAFNGRDSERLPADFLGTVNNRLGATCELALAKKAAAISGGFLLIYGDIEENCSFEAIIAAKAHKLSDIVADMLFNS